jgi:hypothetical protein
LKAKVSIKGSMGSLMTVASRDGSVVVASPESENARASNPLF